MSQSSETDESTIAVDQAIFTSIRTPTGEGYRIIAASGGVEAEERAEITQRAPSHGSLLRRGEEALGLSAWPLRDGRHCVGFSQFAGREHTARGGLRVHTHYAILERDDFEKFGCNALRVHSAIRLAVCGQPSLESDPNMGKLQLRSDVIPLGWNFCDESVGIRPLAAAILQGDETLVTHSGDPLRLLEAVLTTLPVAGRRFLSVTAGLKYSPSRKAQICLLEGVNEETHRAIRGRNLVVLDIGDTSPRPASPYDPWLTFMEDWLASDRRSELVVLANHLSEDISPEALARVAAICRDTDKVHDADTEALSELAMHYANMKTSFETEEQLVSDLLEAIEKRRKALSRPQVVPDVDKLPARAPRQSSGDFPAL